MRALESRELDSVLRRSHVRISQPPELVPIIVGITKLFILSAGALHSHLGKPINKKARRIERPCITTSTIVGLSNPKASSPND
jgi:hypothetical protein